MGFLKISALCQFLRSFVPLTALFGTCLSTFDLSLSSILFEAVKSANEYLFPLAGGEVSEDYIL